MAGSKPSHAVDFCVLVQPVQVGSCKWAGDRWGYEGKQGSLALPFLRMGVDNTTEQVEATGRMPTGRD